MIAYHQTILDALMKCCVYEILATIQSFYKLPFVIITSGLNLFIFVSYYLEIAAVRRYFGEDTIISLQIVNISCLILYPILATIIIKSSVGKTNKQTKNYNFSNFTLFFVFKSILCSYNDC